MRKLWFWCSLSMLLAATSAVAADQDFCNRSFLGAIKVCHPLGTAPAGVVNLGNGWELAVLDPTSGWRNVNAGINPALATFHHGKLVSLDRQIPYFEDAQSVIVQPSPAGGHVVTIHAYKGGNAPDRYFTIIIHVLPNGQITTP